MAWFWCLLALQALLVQVYSEIYDANKVKFYLYKWGTEENPYELKPSGNFEESGFDSKLETFMFIHGYGGGHLKPPAQTIKNALLKNNNANVILVNYGPYSFPYLNLYSKSRLIAKTSASLINSLINEQYLNIDKFTLIGHSFGSHISGFTANYINGLVPRIVGLDPAGPFFKNANPKDRLSEDDAAYVDCIHTSPVLGINKAICTVDYFPNGGSLQPACADTDDSELLFGTCSHQVAVDYFAEAIISPKTFPAEICSSDIEAKSAASSKKCTLAPGVYMGIYPKKPQRGSYFVEVPNSVAPNLSFE